MSGCTDVIGGYDHLNINEERERADAYVNGLNDRENMRVARSEGILQTNSPLRRCRSLNVLLEWIPGFHEKVSYSWISPVSGERDRPGRNRKRPVCPLKHKGSVRHWLTFPVIPDAYRSGEVVNIVNYCCNDVLDSKRGPSYTISV